MNNLLKNHFFWKRVVNRTSIFSKPTDKLYYRTLDLLKYAYVALFILVFIQIGQVDSLINSTVVETIWPVFFVNQQNLCFIVYFFAANLLAGLIFIQFKNTQLLRIYIFIFYFLLAALSNSFGKINHSLHFVLIPLFCFALMPGAKQSSYKEKTCLIFLSAKFFLLLAYTLTGFWKIFWGINEFFTQEVSLFSPLSFRNILILQFETTEKTILGNWFLEHYIIGWLLYLFVVYLEFVSVAIFFKPNLYKAWGIALILLHLGSKLILDVNMYPTVFSIGVLLILSPFQKHANLQFTLKSLPIIDLFFLRQKKKS